MIDKPMAVEDTCPTHTVALPLAAAVSAAMMNLCSRSLREVAPPAISLYNDVIAVCGALVYMRFFEPENNPTPIKNDFSTHLVTGSAIIGWLGVLANVKGYQTVTVAAVAGIATYVSVPLNYGLQVFVFGEMPDWQSTV